MDNRFSHHHSNQESDRSGGDAQPVSNRFRSSMQITFAPSVSARRLPVYLLLDCSESMDGPYIEAVRHGVEVFRQEVLDFPPAASSVHVGVITFGSRARLETGEQLVSVRSFTPPQLVARGKTRLGLALEMLLESIDHQVRKPTPGGPPADHRPLVFVLTDGEPTGDDRDPWEETRQEVLQQIQQKRITVVTVGCGPAISEDNLRAIAMGPTFKMDDAESSFRSFFRWMSSSVVRYSEQVSAPRQESRGRQEFEPPAATVFPNPPSTFFQIA